MAAGRIAAEDGRGGVTGHKRSGTWSQGELAVGEEARGASARRIEAPLDAGLVVRGGDQVVNIPLVAILERPQHTPPQSPLNVSVERLAWDSLAVDLGGAARRRHRGALGRGPRVGRVQHPLAGIDGRCRADDGRPPLDSRGRCAVALRAARGGADQPA